MKKEKAFEQSKADKEPAGMKEGSKKEMAMDKKQTKPAQRMPKRNQARVI